MVCTCRSTYIMPQCDITVYERHKSFKTTSSEYYMVVQTSQDSYTLVHKYDICYCNDFLNILEQIKSSYPDHAKLLINLIKARKNILIDQELLNEKNKKRKQLTDELDILQKEIDQLESNITKLLNDEY